MDLSLSDKAKLAEHLKKCLVILPNDEYLKELAKKLTDDNVYKDVDFTTELDSNYIFGRLRMFISRCIISSFDELRNYYYYDELRSTYNNVLTDFIIENMPKDLLHKKIHLLKIRSENEKNPLFHVAQELLTIEIKKYYEENKEFLHVKS
jgi:hypothetical protein